MEGGCEDNNGTDEWLHDLFNACDTCHTGHVDVQQFTRAVCHPSNGFGVDESTAPLVFNALDKDGDGFIDFSDLVAGFSEFVQLKDSRNSDEMLASASSSGFRGRRDSLHFLFAAVEPNRRRLRENGEQNKMEITVSCDSTSNLSSSIMVGSSHISNLHCRNEQMFLSIPDNQADITKSSSCPEHLDAAWLDQDAFFGSTKEMRGQLRGRKSFLRDSGAEFIALARTSMSSSSTLAVAELVSEMRARQEENNRLENLYSREKETLDNRLQAFEEEMENALADVEEKAAESARMEFEHEKRRLEGRIDSVRDKMQAHFTLFKKIEEWLAQEERARSHFMKQAQTDMTRVYSENKELRDSLVEAQGNMALLHAQLARLRTDHEDKCRELVRKHAEVQEQSARETQLLQQLNMMREASQRLQDTNDSLLGLVESQQILSQSASSNSGFHQHQPDQLGLDFGAPMSASRDVLGGQDVNGSHALLERQHEPDGLQVPMELVAMRLLTTCDSGRSTLRDVPEDFNDHDSDSDSSGPPSPQEPDPIFYPPQVKAMRKISPAPHSNPSWSSSSSFEAQAVPARKVHEPSFGTIKSTYKVVLCGDSAVGKSSFIDVVCKGHFTNNIPSTLGVDFQMKVLAVDGEPVAVQLWDTAGQEKFRSLVKTYFRRADGVILIYDVTVERTFVNVRRWLQDVEQAAGEGVPVILCANKIDLRDGGEPMSGRMVDFKAGSQLAAEIGCIFMETSAKTGRHLNEALISLCREMGARQIEEKRLGSHTPIRMLYGHGDDSQQVNQAKSKSSCCSSRQKQSP